AQRAIRQLNAGLRPALQLHLVERRRDALDAAREVVRQRSTVATQLRAVLCGQVRGESHLPSGRARWPPPGPVDRGRAARRLLVEDRGYDFLDGALHLDVVRERPHDTRLAGAARRDAVRDQLADVDQQTGGDALGEAVLLEVAHLLGQLRQLLRGVTVHAG